MSHNMIFANIIYQYRKENKLSQEKMAEICHISTRHYQNLESGKVNPRLDTVLHIASVLDISLDSLKDKEGND